MPDFVHRLRQVFADQAGTERTIIPGDDVCIDFTTGTLTYRGEPYRFPPLGAVPQSLVVAGGVENLVAQRISSNRQTATASSRRSAVGGQ